MTVDDIYQYTRKLIKKNQAGGLDSVEWAIFWNAEQCSYQDDLLGRFQPNSNGKSGINTGLIENQTILTKLSPFIKNNASLAISSGIASKPAGFIYELGLRVNGYDAVKINHGQIASVNRSEIDPPSVADNAYYVVEYEGTYSFLPTTMTSASLDYIVTPTDVLWNYTLDADSRKVYNPTGSSQPQWSTNSCIEITKRVLKTLGVSFKDADFENFGQSVITTGN